jgi:hypothetical protein
MENDRWLARIPEEQLIQDVEQNSKGDAGGKCKENKLPKRQRPSETLDRRQQFRKQPHGKGESDSLDNKYGVEATGERELRKYGIKSNSAAKGNSSRGPGHK